MPSFTQLFNVCQTGMRLNMLNLDTVSNNLANVNTDGFKSSRLDFQELLDGSTLEGSTLVNQQKNASQGAIKTTDRAMDWAISGDGYFAVRMVDGRTAYTRNGSFQLDVNHNIVTTDGLPLVWDGAIPVQGDQVEIDNYGTVTYSLNGTRTVAGQVDLYRFVNSSGLESEGDNLFVESAASGAALQGQPGSQYFGQTIGSSLENSNVDLSQEYTNMIILQRVFETTVRALQQSNTMLTQAIQMRQG